MGIIRKQSLFSTFFIYVGFAIGALNLLILGTKFLSQSQQGLTRVLLDIGLLFSSFCTLGSINIVYKFFPLYQKHLPEKENDLHALSFLLTTLGLVIFLSIFTFFQPFILSKFTRRPGGELLTEYFYLVYPLTITYTYFLLFESYAWVLKKTILSNFIKEILFRVCTTILLVLYGLDLITIQTFFKLFGWIYLPAVLLLGYAVFSHPEVNFHFKLSFITKRFRKKIIQFGGFLFIGVLLNTLSKTFDVLVITAKSSNGLADATLFLIPTFLITVMDVPLRGVTSIAVPIISEAWRNKDLPKILQLYQKTSLNLLFGGLLLGGAVLLNMDNAVIFLGPDYAPIKTIAFILAASKLIDLGLGLNGQILFLSKHWRLDFSTNMFLLALSIPLNFWLTSNYGINGTAVATLISFFLYNTIRLAAIYYYFKIQPFTANTYKLCLFAAALFVGVYQLPFMYSIYLDAFVRTGLFALVFIIGSYFLQLSSDINEVIHTVMNRLGFGKS
ncbi:MAG: hypothetical protein EAZ47_00250 [Bacteroidetes bacterium]|nr:MAG: hypothetical protein EAY72_03295 [Bacteroidota bacterium]TAE72422.1 MAG: hypothetical protein EAY68_01220 [Bacteroidota bacterium]TAF98462.1 MAG: hypothetical protein EAZ47_00250 [Bacteroidota bacterium]